MIIRNLLTVLFLFFGLSLCYSQGSIYKKAEKAFQDKQFNKAKELYERAYDRSVDRREKTKISFQMANCARLMGEFRSAQNYYKRTIKLRYFEMFSDPLVFYYLGQCYKGQGMYNEAISNFENYKLKKGADVAMANSAIQGCQMSKEWISEGSRYRVKNVKKINSRYNDFSPAFGDKKNKFLFFSSSREEAVGKEKDKTTNEDFPDIFYSYDDTDHEIKKAKKRGKKIDPKNNMPFWIPPTNDSEEIVKDLEESGKYDHVKGLGKGLEEINKKKSVEAAVSFTKGGKKMYFTQSTWEKNKWNPRRIYSVEVKSGKFGEPVLEKIPVDVDSEGYPIDVLHPAISADGKTLYFVAEMDGGFGGYDIYRCTYDRRKKEWGEPTNLNELGVNINTSGDEKFPYISKSGALFFSSTGHVGMGGLDIYKSELTDNGFSHPVNMRYPINTPYDDFGIVFEDETEIKGYISSSREGKKWKPRGGDDIYLVDLQLIFTEVEGVVYDEATVVYDEVTGEPLSGEPLSGVKVELVGGAGEYYSTLTDGNGYYKISLEHFKENQDYQIQFDKEWFFPQRDNTISTFYENMDQSEFLELPDGNKLQTIKRQALLKTNRRPMVLKSVEFDVNKFDLRPRGMEELDSLADLLIYDYPNHVIELRSHTDFRGTQEINIPLSQNRAQSCVDYLVDKGVSADRLVAIGMSDSEPKTLKTDINGLTSGTLDKTYINSLKSNMLVEAAHQFNRRTDFKIISENFEDWFEENKKLEPSIKNGLIDSDGNLIDLDE
tara:strand:- start:21 stop:2342 length:2322 start_codon:yes stop_codon:yes gene_type:complete